MESPNKMEGEVAEWKRETEEWMATAQTVRSSIVLKSDQKINCRNTRQPLLQGAPQTHRSPSSREHLRPTPAPPPGSTSDPPQPLLQGAPQTHTSPSDPRQPLLQGAPQPTPAPPPGSTSDPPQPLLQGAPQTHASPSSREHLSSNGSSPPRGACDRPEVI